MIKLTCMSASSGKTIAQEEHCIRIGRLRPYLNCFSYKIYLLLIAEFCRVFYRRHSFPGWHVISYDSYGFLMCAL